MNREEIIRMAREAGALVGIKHMTDSTGEMIVFDPDDLERFAALVAAAERERCAKECDDLAKEAARMGQGCSDGRYDHASYGMIDCAAAIRAL